MSSRATVPAPIWARLHREFKHVEPKTIALEGLSFIFGRIPSNDRNVFHIGVRSLNYDT